jgi:hypothetical protein
MTGCGFKEDQSFPILAALFCASVEHLKNTSKSYCVLKNALLELVSEDGLNHNMLWFWLGDVAPSLFS